MGEDFSPVFFTDRCIDRRILNTTRGVNMPYWFWLVCGTTLLIVEILAPHFVTIWFALAALITGVVAYWVGGIAAQLTIFSVSSIILFSIGWFWLRNNMQMSARARHAKEADRRSRHSCVVQCGRSSQW